MTDGELTRKLAFFAIRYQQLTISLHRKIRVSLPSHLQ